MIETDLGDRLVQLEGKDKSTHTLAPAIHIPIEDVTTLLSNNVGRELECDLEALVRAARESLREYLTTADVGISGANAIDAETGSIFLTENEGNIRCVTSMARKSFQAYACLLRRLPRIAYSQYTTKALPLALYQVLCQ